MNVEKFMLALAISQQTTWFKAQQKFRMLCKGLRVPLKEQTLVAVTNAASDMMAVACVEIDDKQEFYDYVENCKKEFCFAIDKMAENSVMDGKQFAVDKAVDDKHAAEVQAATTSVEKDIPFDVPEGFTVREITSPDELHEILSNIFGERKQ